MDIVIVANFASNFSKSSNGRFYYLAKMLVAEEHDVEIITSNFNHLAKKHVEEPKGLEIKPTLLYEPGYKKNISIMRFVSHMKWGKRVYRYLKKRKKPDVIFCAVPSLTGPYLTAKYCKKKNVKFIVDIQDLWPEAFQMFVTNKTINNTIFFPLRKMADSIYKRADVVCGVSDEYCERALRVNKKCSKGVTAFLGTELKKFDDGVKSYTGEIKPQNEIWLGYCGSLATSYDLPLVFNALKALGDMAPHFVVMGLGPLKTKFEEQVKALGIDVTFTGGLEYPQMCGMLNQCDIVINPIVKKSVASIINKHADYAACGKPVLNTQDNAGYRRLVDEYKMGFNCKNGDVEDLAEKMLALIKDKALREEMGENARKLAVEKFDRPTTYRKLVDAITSD